MGFDRKQRPVSILKDVGVLDAPVGTVHDLRPLIICRIVPPEQVQSVASRLDHKSRLKFLTVIWVRNVVKPQDSSAIAQQELF